MDFRLEFTPKQFADKLNYRHSLFLAGSCFTEQMGARLHEHKFKIIDNPNGILFNPISIASAITNYIEPKRYLESELFYAHELWGSWDHHTSFSDPDPQRCLQKINDSQQSAHTFLKNTDWLMITLGSAFVYETNAFSQADAAGRVVANCHKVPADKFNKKLLSIEAVLSSLDAMLYRVRKFNPGIKIIFTISPVRHLRDGFTENNRSKSILINAVHQLVDKFSDLFYFPAYELIIDDLRDYRFFAEDMVHPNYAATRYVWEKFIATCIDAETQEFMKAVQPILAARKHKAFHPTSSAHALFMKKNLERVQQLKQLYPEVDMDEELLYFKSVVDG